MILPIIGLIISLAMMGFVDAVFWMFMISGLAPSWLIIASFIVNILAGVLVVGFIVWIKDECEWRKIR